MSLWCGGNEFEIVTEKEHAEKQLVASLHDSESESGSTPIPPSNTPRQGIEEKDTDIKEALRRVTMAFAPSTSDLLDLTEAMNNEVPEDQDDLSDLNEGPHDDDIAYRAENQKRVSIQRMLLQSPHFMRSRQRMLEDETTSLSSVPHGDLATQGQFSPMSQHMHLCSPYSDMTSVKSEMLIPEKVRGDRLDGEAAPMTIKEKFALDSGVFESKASSESNPNSDETTNEVSDASAAQSANDFDRMETIRNTSRSTSSSSVLSSITGASATTSRNSTTSSNLRVKPGKKYTFRRRVGKAASFIMRAGKKRERTAGDTDPTSVPTPLPTHKLETEKVENYSK